MDNVLDNDTSAGVSDIPNRVWVEMLENTKKYPVYVVETARQQVLLRNMNELAVEITPPEPQDQPANIFLWIHANPVLAGLTVLAAVLSGYKGALVVLVSVYAGTRHDKAAQKNIWRATAFALLFLTAAAVAVSYFVRR